MPYFYHDGELPDHVAKKLDAAYDRRMQAGPRIRNPHLRRLFIVFLGVLLMVMLTIAFVLYSFASI